MRFTSKSRIKRKYNPREYYPLYNISGYMKNVIQATLTNINQISKSPLTWLKVAIYFLSVTLVIRSGAFKFNSELTIFNASYALITASPETFQNIYST